MFRTRGGSNPARDSVGRNGGFFVSNDGWVAIRESAGEEGVAAPFFSAPLRAAEVFH